MAIRGADGTYNQTATTFTAATEVIAATLGPLEVPGDSVRAIVRFMGNLVTSGGTTTCLASIRRGATITDTLLSQNQPCPVTASNGFQFVMEVVDTLAGLATVTYVGTIYSAGAASTGKNAALTILFL